MMLNKRNFVANVQINAKFASESKIGYVDSFIKKEDSLLLLY